MFEWTPLPTDYWTRPIYPTNREWHTIGGNWLKGTHPTGNFNPDTLAPNTAHIVWTKPTEFGGIVGGQYGDTSYHTGSAYENMWTGGSGIIISGKMYYNEPKSPRNGWYCVDLRTGEEIFYHNGTGPIQIGSQTGAHIGATNIPYQFPQLAFAQIYNYDTGNQHGSRAYLWTTYTDTFGSTYNYTMQNGTKYSFTSTAGSTVWEMYNAFTGKWICNIANVPSGTRTLGPNGEILIYAYNSNTGALSLWNSSVALGFPNNNLEVPYDVYQSAEAFYWMWREPIGRTVDGRDGYSWTKNVTKGLGSISVILDDRIIGVNGISSFQYGVSAYSVWALSLKAGQEGTLLWKKDYSQPPILNATITLGPASLDDGVFTMRLKETMQWYGFDLDTGNQIWGPTASQPQYDMYGMGGNIAYGKLFSVGYGGIMYCYNIADGTLLWNSTLNTGGLEGPYPYWPAASGSTSIADNKVYVITGEHSHSHPLLRGWTMYCYDVNTGKNLWNFTGLWNSFSIADGYMINYDNMDNQIYCFGKGQTTTTVTASPEVSVYGSSILIKGTVLDQSPGAKDTPAIADQYMTEWMEYKYHQRSKPTNVQGVEVILDVIDSNGNFRPIGTTTSDVNGFYSLNWKPDIEGTYTVIAKFAGTESYWPSQAVTAFAVDQAPPQPTEQPVASVPPTDMYVLGMGIAIIIAIALLGILLLRKRP